jgi:kynureninase
VHERHAYAGLPRLAGWWGHDKESRFRMEPDFVPIPGAEGWQLSNPAILPLAALRASMEMFDSAGMPALRRKSELLTGYLYWLLSRQLGDAWDIITPEDPAQRGCQLSLRFHRDGRRVFDRLTREGVICDWREPDVIRVAPVPLYNTYTDVHRFASIVRSTISTL